MAIDPEPSGGGLAPCHELDCSQESHGRRLTTTPDAASRYRAAQSEYRDRERLVAALRGALRADPGFAVAAADLAALAGGAPGDPALTLHGWERHHLEVVAAAAGHNPRRAVDLLREHLSAVVCDPVATAVVLDAATDEPLEDILGELPSCHRPAARRADRMTNE
jgi:hypothetical protein